MTRIALLNDIDGIPGEGSQDRVRPANGEGWSDHGLVQRCAQRISAAMQEIVERYQQKLYRFLLRLLGSHEDAEEAVLDVFLRVWQQADRFEGRAAFTTWLYRIAANVACDLLRQRQSQNRAASRVPLADWPNASCVNPEEAALNSLEREERSRRLQQALQTLRGEDRLLLVLYYAEEMSYEEIREITKFAYPVLKMRLMRARKRLRVVMDTLADEANR